MEPGLAVFGRVEPSRRPRPVAQHLSPRSAWWQLHTFRLVVVASLIAGVRMLPLMSGYVVAGPMREAVDALLAVPSRLEYQAVMRTGGLLINTALGREPVSGLPLVIRYTPDAATSALCYVIGLLAIASARWSRSCRRGAVQISMLLLALCVVIVAPYLPALAALLRDEPATLPEEPAGITWSTRHAPAACSSLC
jgi:hypothetical protein